MCFCYFCAFLSNFEFFCAVFKKCKIFALFFAQKEFLFSILHFCAFFRGGLAHFPPEDILLVPPRKLSGSLSSIPQIGFPSSNPAAHSCTTAGQVALFRWNASLSLSCPIHNFGVLTAHLLQFLPSSSALLIPGFVIRARLFILKLFFCINHDTGVSGAVKFKSSSPSLTRLCSFLSFLVGSSPATFSAGSYLVHLESRCEILKVELF